MKRILKYLGRIIGAIFLLLLLVVFLIYLPPVQKFVVNKALNYASAHYGLVIKAEKFRLGFPLKLKLENVFVGKSAADTLLMAHSLKMNVGLKKIFWKEVSVDDLELKQVRLVMENDTTGMHLDTRAGELSLSAKRVSLPEKKVAVDFIRLKEGEVNLVTGNSPGQDSAVAKTVDWTFEIDRIDLHQIAYRMGSNSLPFLNSGLKEGWIAGGRVALKRQTVNVDSVYVSGGWCNMILEEKQTEPEKPSGTVDSLKPWTIRAGALQLENSAFQLKQPEQPQMKLILAGIGIQLDSVYNRGSAVKAVLKDLKAVQREGIEITAMKATVDLDTTVTALHGMYLQTPYSWLRLEAQADTSLQHLMEKIPLMVNLNGRISMLDVLPFYPDIPLAIRQKAVGINASLALAGERIQLGQLIMDMPGHFRMTGSGRATRYRRLAELRGKMNLRAELEDITFIKDYLQGEGIHIPRHMSFTAALKADRGDLTASADVECYPGMLKFSGNYQMTPERYEGEIELTRFPLSSFLPQDSLGEVSAQMNLTGNGFSWPQAKADVVARIQDFSYRRHEYKDMDLQVSLDHTRLRGSFTSKDSLAPIELIFRGDSVETAYQMEVMGRVDEVDLQALHLVTEPLKVEMDLQIQAEMASQSTYGLSLSLDSLRMTDRQRNYFLGRLELEMQSDPEKVGLTLKSGDLNLKFCSDTSLTAFVAQVQQTALVLKESVKEKNVDMNLVKKELPAFSLLLTGGRENAVAGFLKSRNIGFKNIYFDAVSRKRQGLRLGFQANAPYFGKVRLDSVQFGAWQTGKSLAYIFNAGSSAESWKGLFNINLTGRIQENQLRVELKQKNNEGEIGFDLGMNLTLLDSAFAVSFFPMNPILGYSRWIVNSDNRIVVNKNLKINADLRMTYRDKLVSIRSLEALGDRKDRLQIEFQGINLENLSRMLPFMPEFAGEMNTDLMLYSQENAMGVDGNVGVRNLYYQGQRIGTLELGLQYAGKNRFTEHAVDFELKIDSIRRAVAKGVFSTSEKGSGLHVDVDIPSLPLYVANAFMPPGILQLGGELNGYLRFRGTMDRPLLSGELAFRDGKANVLMVGTTFSLDAKPLIVEDGKVLFRQYRFMAPNNSNLVVNGEITLTPFDRMGMNLTVKAADFEVVNVKKNTSSLIYGKAYTDINTQITGTFADLSVSGNVNLLNRTAIVYTLRNSGPQLVDHNQELVRFVSFRDTTLNETDDLTNRVKTGSFSLRLLIGIGNRVNATVALSEDGSNNITIQGGGNLGLVMSPESGMTLTGRYIISGGTVVYNIPIAGKKEFSIQSGSYVEWTGNVANPLLNISASESVKATVEDGDRNRLVTFESIIRIQNTLNQPDITFDLSAPNDMVIQNQLATFSKEERTRQALNLMIYNTYTAPGAAKSQGGNNVANNALYSFVENELNKYTRRVGLTVGMDSYNTDENTVRTDVTYEFSKQFFNDRVRIKIGGRISTDNNDNPSNSGNLQDNLVDDISIEYVFTKKRNLFLKVFRHSNYESVLDGEVTQTGVGIVWRKDFRKFKDLFKNKNREERRKLKQEAKAENAGNKGK